MADTKSINNAFITKVKSPSVKIFIGRVKNNNIGLINAFTTPNTKAVIKAAQKPPIETPGKIYEVPNTAKVKINQFIKSFIIFLFNSYAMSIDIIYHKATIMAI